MPKELEIEFKNLLKEEEYLSLFEAYNFSEEDAFFQENSYFDSKDFQLKNVGAALRIRLKKDYAEITLKTPSNGHLLETNVSLSIKEAHEMISDQIITLPKEISLQLTEIGVDHSTSFHLITHLKTKRVEKKIDECLLVLDQSWYAEKVDFELEVEAPTAQLGQTFFEDLLINYSIPKRETKNKIQRATEAFTEQKNANQGKF